MVVQRSIPVGQQQARMRWGTHASGEAFDRKKSSYLTEQAQKFMAQQALCVVSGLDPQNELGGLLILDTPGFVQALDTHTCLIKLDSSLRDTRIVQRLLQAHLLEEEIYLGLFFICHPTRERLCVQGTAELLRSDTIDQPPQPPRSIWQRLQDFLSKGKQATQAPQSLAPLWVRLHVQRSFFHCAKYIKTRIAGLTYLGEESAAHKWRQFHLPGPSYLSDEVRAFLAEQILCYLCTVDQKGECAVNHRGGAAGFLVTLPPDEAAPGGTILLPDYTGNGAFEAIGNIFETGQAALVVPNYAAQLALCISGSARVLEPKDLAPELAQRCAGAERVVALSVQHVEMQRSNWSEALTYERARAKSVTIANINDDACTL